MNARANLSEPAGLMDDVAQLRMPPHSIESESSVLGGLLLDNSAWDRVSDLLGESDFYRSEHRLIYAALATLINANREADVITVFGHLQAIGKDQEAGGIVYLNSLAQYVPSAGNIRRYAEIVRERAILRKLVTASDEIASNAFNPQGKPVATILDEAEQRIFQIGQVEQAGKADDWEGADSGMVRLLDRIQKQADGTEDDDFIPTGLTELDERLDGGMRPGELIVIGARPSMGKSAMALSIGMNIALDQGLPVGLFSMEMGKAQVHNRMMSVVSAIHLSRIKRAGRLKDFDWPKISTSIEKLRKAEFHVNDQSGLNINQVRAKSRALHRRHKKMGLIIVDYLGLMNGTDPKMPRVYQLEEVTKGLKALGKELNVPVVLLAQLNRKVEERTDQMPILSDLRDSGSIEQDADVVIFVHRPIKANPNLGDEWKYYAKVSVAKLRDGEPGYLDLMYVGENTHFMDWPEATEKPSNLARMAATPKRREL